MIILTEGPWRAHLFPFTTTRHTADIRIGILTIREKWRAFTNEPITTDENESGFKVPAHIVPSFKNFKAVLAASEVNQGFEAFDDDVLQYPWQIFQRNEAALRDDFFLLTKGRHSAPLSSTNSIVGEENIFAEDGVIAEHSLLNASAGPIYLGKNAEIMEGCLIRGPFSMGENSRLKMGAKIYGATTLGPGCVAGGEIKNSIFFANSNKAHDGYLGDSVIGEWCNLGAGTSNSNVKNSGGAVKYAGESDAQIISAGYKAGLLMGDYSRAAINTSFNTGSIVGVCCNIFGDRMPPKFTADFTWGRERYIFAKALNDINNWKQMKGQHLTEEETAMLQKLYDA